MSEFNEAAIHTTVRHWYRALDRHDPAADVLHLVDHGLEMHMPEGVFQGHDGFLDWYERVCNTFFDEEHTVNQVEVHFIAPDTARVTVHVNWQAKVWDRPSAASTWLGFDAYQTWTVVWKDGRVKVRTYVVDVIEAMPGSVAL